MTLSGRNYIMCRQPPLYGVQPLEELKPLQQLMCDKDRVRMYLSQMVDTMYFE